MMKSMTVMIVAHLLLSSPPLLPPDELPIFLINWSKAINSLNGFPVINLFYLTITFFTVPSLYRMIFRPFSSFDSLTPKPLYRETS